MTDQPQRGATTGLGYGITAYLIWGFFPVYFKWLRAVPALQVVAHRIVWSAVFLVLVLFGLGRWPELREAVRNRRSVVLLGTTALLIATNWLVFVLAVGHAQVIQSSLGYFITPLVSVLLGMLVLHERLRRLQFFSLLFAAAGVLLLAAQLGQVPWAALTLALTFGSYGLLRKVVAVEALVGLTLETLLLVPFAAAYLGWVTWQGTGAFLAIGTGEDILLLAAGVVTAVPLLLFALAARRLKLATIGFLQYLTPTLHFLLAVFVYGEPFTLQHLVSFSLIWAGLGIYSLDAWRAVRIYSR